MKNKKILVFILIFFAGWKIVNASGSLAEKLSGRILLQVESRGEAWYVNPVDLRRYFLGRPTDAFELMRRLGLGIRNVDLEKIAIAQSSESHSSQNDNLVDNSLARKNAGRILLQVESHGEAWYVNPVDLKRYFLGRPTDAFELMRRLGLGIRNQDLDQINIYSTPKPQPLPTTNQTPDAGQVISSAATAIRRADTKTTLTYFTSEMEKTIQYTMDFLSKEQKFILAGILSDAKLTKSSDTEKTYTTEVYFNGAKHPVNFVIKKQDDGKWLMTNL